MTEQDWRKMLLLMTKKMKKDRKMGIEIEIRCTWLSYTQACLTMKKTTKKKNMKVVMTSMMMPMMMPVK